MASGEGCSAAPRGLTWGSHTLVYSQSLLGIESSPLFKAFLIPLNHLIFANMMQHSEKQNTEN